jgi:hypothetical protein
MGDTVRIYENTTTYITKAGIKERKVYGRYIPKTDRRYRKSDTHDIINLLKEGKSIADIKKELKIGDYAMAKCFYDYIVNNDI